MNIFKAIFTYTLILIGLALTGALVIASILYFNKDAVIFGYSYVSGFKGEKVIEIDVDSASYNKIEVTTDNIEIEVVPYGDETEEEIKVTYAIAADGFTNDEDTRDFSIRKEIVDGTVEIEIIEPTGFIWHRDSYIIVEVPYYLASDRKELEITSDGGKITVGQEDLNEDPDLIVDRQFKLNTLTLNNSTATMVVRNVSVSEELNIKNKAFKTYVQSDITGDVIIDSYVGSFDFVDSNGIRTDIAGNLTVLDSSVNPAIKAGTLGGELVYGSNTEVVENGLLDIATIEGDIVIYSENVEIDFGTILQSLTLETKNSMIDIDTIGLDSNEADYVSLNIDSSRLNIGDLFYNTTIDAGRGNVTITGLAAFADIDTDEGDVTVDFKNNDVAYASKYDYSYVTSTLDFILEASTSEGDITVNGIDKRVSLVTGSGNICAEFELVTTDGGHSNGDNIVTTTSGNIDLVVPAESTDYDTDTYLDINRTTDDGDFDVDVIGADRNDSAKWIETRVNCYDIYVGDENAVTGTIVVTTNTGDITVSDNI